MSAAHKKLFDMDYPQWVCSDCGHRYGYRTPGMATWHEDTCDVCGTEKVGVTEPRDFGHLRDEWKRHKVANNAR